MMKVLVIGGSYFLGRVFVMFAHEKFDLTLINRGTYSMKSFGVKEYILDRHEEKALSDIDHDFDVIVDFCAYQQGDIAKIVEYMKGSVKQYIMVSTVDVYQRQTGVIKDETHPLETRRFGGNIGTYIDQKILLENELIKQSRMHHFHYTILRPGMIYGPYNYAPRESELIKRIANHLPLVSLTDANASFQLVYVKDVALAIIQCIEKKAYDCIYNVINPQLLNYDSINHLFQSITNIDILSLNSSQAQSTGYPLPFPIFKTEEELYNGEKICQELDFHYTSFKDGMTKTLQATLPIYQQK